MHESAEVPGMSAVKLDLALLSILFLVVPLLVVCAIVYARRRRSSLTSSVSHSRLGFFGELTWLSAPVIVAATFAGISASESGMTGWNRHPRTPATASQPGSSTKSLGPLAITPVPTDDRSTTASADGQTQRPAWIDQPRTVDGVIERIVIASQQYTTRDEAELELSAGAADLLLRDLQQLHPGSSRASSWHPSSEEIKRRAVKQQYVEVVERDFGNFFHPMYRVWWQVELSPEVRTEFLPAWKRGLTLNRIHFVGVVATSLVMVASVWATCHRLNFLTPRGGRTWLWLLTGSAVVFCLGAIGNWWSFSLRG